MAAPNTAQQMGQVFQQQRAQAVGAVNAQAQQQSDAIKRRMSAIGQGSGSGAAMGLQRQLANDTANQRVNAIGQVNAAEAQANLAAAEAQAGREFQSNEARLGREFQAGESRLGREFAGGESALSRQQQESQFGRTLSEQGRMFDVEQGNKLKQLDMANQNLQLEREAQWFNQRMAELQSGNQIDLDISRGQFTSPEAYDRFLRRLQQLDRVRQHRAVNPQTIAPDSTVYASNIAFRGK